MKIFLEMARLLNSRTAAVFALGFASGLPLALIGSTLQAWYTLIGVDLHTIGLLSLVGLPYLYKFLWAPILDKFPLFRLGKRRSWILVMQACLVVTLILMASFDPGLYPLKLAVVALFLAFFSATQDIAIDAYRTDLLLPKERGIGATFNTLGYRLAMVFSGAIAMILASKFGFQATYLIMAVVMLVEIAITLMAPKPEEEIEASYSWREVIVEPLREFLSRKYAILILLFILFYKFSDALALALNTNFLLSGVGFSLIEVGSISKLAGLIAALVGALFGGVALRFLNLYYALLCFGILQTLSNLTFMWLALVGKNLYVMAVAVIAENFTGGLATVAFVALLMGLCDKRYTATQFAIFSAVASIGRVIIGPIAAVMVTHLGWAHFYFWTFIIGIPVLFLLLFLRKRINFKGEKIEAW